MRRLVALFACAALAVAQTPQNSATVWIGGAVSGASNLTTAGAIPYVSAAATLSQDSANLFWDSANARLGIGTNAPSQQLQIGGSSRMIQLWQDGGGVNILSTSTLATSFGGLGSGAVYFIQNGAGTTNRLLTLSSGAVGIGPGNTSPTGTLSIQDLTATTGNTRVTIGLGAADTSSTAVLTVNGVIKFGGSNSTGAGSAALGANSPATTLTAPYTWLKVTTSDGSVAYIPAWK